VASRFYFRLRLERARQILLALGLKKVSCQWRAA
jgi:hypothetical protein